MTKAMIETKVKELYEIAEKTTTTYGLEAPKTIKAWREYEKWAARLES